MIERRDMRGLVDQLEDVVTSETEDADGLRWLASRLVAVADLAQGSANEIEEDEDGDEE